MVDLIECKFLNELNERLLAPFTSDEIGKTIFQMHPNMSPSLDGLNTTFYQKFWHIVRATVAASCQHWLYFGVFL